MDLIGKSLDAVSSVGPGSSITFDVPHAVHSLQAITTGAPVHAVLDLEGTLDGSTWNTLASIDVGMESRPPSAIVSVTAAVMGLRAHLNLLYGGASPTVTAWVAAAS